ncbi:MAG: class I SAM-dependent methyltransferase [Actinomycetota bacterium]
MPFLLKDKFLEISSVYGKLMGFLLGANTYTTLVNEYIQPTPGCSVLDVGCGPAAILDLLQDVKYIGLDHNPNYIATATRKYGSKGTFICDGVDQLNDYGLKTFDRIIILGVMHHLDDSQLIKLMTSLKNRLNHGGVLITFDVAFEDRQNLVAKLLAKNDRGKFVRTKEQYRKFIEISFKVQQADLRRDLLRVPYTHLLTRSTALN